MTAIHTFDNFSTLDGYGSYGPKGMCSSSMASTLRRGRSDTGNCADIGPAVFCATCAGANRYESVR